MKKIVYISFSILLIFSLFSCEEVFDKAPLDIMSDDVVWDDEILVNAYIVNVYSEMSFLFRDLGNNTTYETNIYSMLSDEARDGYSWHKVTQLYKPGLTEETRNPIGWWGYSTVRKANDFFVQMESSTLPDETKKVLIARMQFARAFCYFTMVKRFGGVPIITVPQAIDDPADELFVSRNKEVEVYDFILAELDSCASNLIDDADDSGWPTKYSALALKSRAALYAASIANWGQVQLDGVVGIPSNDAQRFWQASYDASKAIIESGKFQLYNKISGDKVENFRQLFLAEDKNSELIFSKQFTGITGIAHSYDAYEFPQQFSGTNGGTTNIYLEMVESFENIDGSSGVLDRTLVESQTWDLQNELFGNKDPRFHASVFFEGSSWQGDILENWQGLIKSDGETITDGSDNGINALGRNASKSNGAGGLLTGFNVKKYCDDGLVIPIAKASSSDFIIFRYGEILLNNAEAAFELNLTAESLDAVNQIRERAGIAQLGSIDRDKIRQERKVELAFEGHRYWDLKRWRIATTAISRQFSGIETIYDANSGKYKIVFIDNVDSGAEASFLEKHYYFPITPDRISNNPNLAPENPGW
jgi:hypothetical protein